MLPKLVRDKIPEILADQGIACDYKILSEEDLIYALECKLDEELAEYRADHSLEELADLVEVIYALAEARGYLLGNLFITMMQKSQERGAFKKGIYLQKIYDKEKKDDC